MTRDELDAILTDTMNTTTIMLGRLCDKVCELSNRLDVIEQILGFEPNKIKAVDWYGTPGLCANREMFGIVRSDPRVQGSTKQLCPKCYQLNIQEEQ